MVKTIKELFTAHYDGEQIRGCRENSLAWYHEHRHKIQMDNPIIRNTWQWLPYITACLGLMMLWFLILVPKIEILIFGGFFILPITIFVILIELDANIYSLIKIISRRKRK